MSEVENPNGSLVGFVRPISKTISQSQEPVGTLLNMLEMHSGESALIKADGLKIFLGVNPTFFAVNADLGPDIRANA